MSQYRIEITGGVMAEITETLPTERWERLAEDAESRGGVSAKLLRRSIHSPDFDRRMLANDKGWMFLKTCTISPWEILAELINY